MVNCGSVRIISFSITKLPPPTDISWPLKTAGNNRYVAIDEKDAEGPWYFDVDPNGLLNWNDGDVWIKDTDDKCILLT